MSGFLSKLTGKKKSTNTLSVEEELALAKQSVGDSWTDHEITDEIVEDQEFETSSESISDTVQLEQPDFESLDSEVISEPDVESTLPTSTTVQLAQADFDATSVDIETTAIRLAKLDISDLDIASDFNETESDQIDAITLKIQKDIEERKRLQAEEERKKQLLEITSEFRKPDFSKDFKE